MAHQALHVQYFVNPSTILDEKLFFELLDKMLYCKACKGYKGVFLFMNDSKKTFLSIIFSS